MNQQPPQKSSNKGLIIGIVVVIGVVGLLGFVCCGAALYLGIGAVEDADRTYYAECEYLEDNDECRQCCRERGHSGTFYGSFINEDDKLCGCAM